MKLEHNKYKCFIIHLQRAVKRKKTVQSIISNIKFESKVINAIDGKKLSSNEISKYVSSKNLHYPNYPFKINKGEIGCFLSHRVAWQKIVTEKLDAGLIIEDDCKINFEEFNKSFEVAIQLIKKLGYIQFQTRDMSNNKKEIFNKNGIKIFHPNTVPLRTAAQLISYDTALSLLKHSEKIDRPVDGFLQLFWLTGQNISCIHPSGISDLSSVLGGSTLSIKNSKRSFIIRTFLRFIYRFKIKMFSKNFQNKLPKDIL